MEPMRVLLALALLVPATLAAPAPAPPEFVQAAEFPYYLCPRSLWERELVWMKTIGIGAVEFSVPWNWHQIQPGRYDLTGATSPRRDLAGLIRILRKLEMKAWVRPLPPMPDWPSPTLDAAAQKIWLKQLEQLLAPQTASHGGPVAWLEPAIPGVDAGLPPSPVAEISAAGAGALAASREAIAAGRKALLWRNVEDALYPAGWAPEGAPLLRKGAVGLGGDEQPATAALRREGALLRGWGALLPAMQPAAMPKPATGKLPEGVTAVELVSGPASAVNVTNRSAQPFRDELRVFEPSSKRTLVIPNVTVPAGESLWLPVTVSIGPSALCRECSHFSSSEHIAYATAELLAIEYENGILAMEFAAPQAGEAILQLARMPVGPFLAAGKLAEFDWDDKALRARLPIPAGSGPGHHVRIGIAIEEPETSGFFNDARRLVIGRKNSLRTTYSAQAVAARSRLRLPEGFTATARGKSPNEIEYDVAVPPDAIHGDWANLALEADGVLLGRARLQMFRPLSVRLLQGIALHFGARTELAADPPIVTIEPRAGTNVEIALRNNAPAIQTFRLEAAGDGLEFLPPKTEISIGAMAERTVSLRAFAKEGAAVVRDWRLRVEGGASLDLPVRAVLLPRGRTVAWSADLDGDGSPEWVLESQRARAVFSTQDGGRWVEFTWKDGAVNFLPEQGLFTGAGRVGVRDNGDTLEFTGPGWKRTVRLAEGELTVEQTTPLPAEAVAPARRANLELRVSRTSPSTAVFRIAASN
jgi:hypothetical protein